MTAPETRLSREENKSTRDELEECERRMAALRKMPDTIGNRISVDFAEYQAKNLRAEIAMGEW